jgi:hypothetical protein
VSPPRNVREFLLLPFRDPAPHPVDSGLPSIEAALPARSS